MPQRKIIHIDMDAFYASVEQRDDPSLQGRPIAVGHDGPRGVVSTASYEARPYGVRSALPSVTARRLCPDLIFVPARFDVYKAVSQQVRDIFREYTELVEPLSLDEAFLDVTHERSATLVAREIKARIRRQTELTASAGVSVNKMLAKIASDYRKPDGLFTIAPSEVEAFVAALPVERFFGIGAVTAERMHRMGIHTGADLRQWDEAALVQRFGKAGHAYYGYARGVDEREVEPHRVRKSVGAETTFAEDTDDRTRLSMELAAVREEVWNRIQRHEFRGKTAVLDLAEHQSLIPTNECAEQDSVAHPVYEAFAKADHLAFQPQENQMAVALVERGLGIAVLPGLALRDCLPGRQVQLLPLKEGYVREIGLLCPRETERSPLANAFLRMTQEQVELWKQEHDTPLL